MAKLTVNSDLLLNPCRLNLFLPSSVQSFKATASGLIDIRRVYVPT